MVVSFIADIKGSIFSGKEDLHDFSMSKTILGRFRNGVELTEYFRDITLEINEAHSHS